MIAAGSEAVGLGRFCIGVPPGDLHSIRDVL